MQEQSKLRKRQWVWPCRIFFICSCWHLFKRRRYVELVPGSAQQASSLHMDIIVVAFQLHRVAKGMGISGVLRGHQQTTSVLVDEGG